MLVIEVVEVEASGYLKRHWPKSEFFGCDLGQVEIHMWWFDVTSEIWGSARDLMI